MADLTITAANVLAEAFATQVDGVAGETITQGMPLFLHTDDELYKADDTTALRAACVGIALNGASNGQPIKYLSDGGYNPGATVAIGTTYGITDTAGGIGPISDRGSGDFITILGTATTTSRIELAISASGVAKP